MLREELWNGNRETWREAFFSRDSIILWALRTYHRRRKEYPVLFSQPQYAHLSVEHLRAPHAARDWLDAQSPGTIAGQSVASDAPSSPVRKN
jgi:hypothetical protein